MNITAEQIDKASPAELSAWIDALRSEGSPLFLYEQPWAFDLNLCAALEAELTNVEKAEYAAWLEYNCGTFGVIFANAAERCRAWLKLRRKVTLG